MGTNNPGVYDSLVPYCNVNSRIVDLLEQPIEVVVERSAHRTNSLTRCIFFRIDKKLFASKCCSDRINIKKRRVLHNSCGDKGLINIDTIIKGREVRSFLSNKKVFYGKVATFGNARYSTRFDVAISRRSLVENSPLKRSLTMNR